MSRVTILWALFGAQLENLLLIHQKLLHQEPLPLHLLHQLRSSVQNLLRLHHHGQKKEWLLFSKKLIRGTLWLQVRPFTTQFLRFSFLWAFWASVIWVTYIVGLRKVTADMKTKNRADRTGVVGAGEKGRTSSPSFSKAGPPKLELQMGRKWVCWSSLYLWIIRIVYLYNSLYLRYWYPYAIPVFSPTQYLLAGGLLRTKLEKNGWLSMIVMPNSLYMFLDARTLSCRFKVF